MSNYEEKRTIIEERPVGRRPVVESQYGHIVHERRGIPGAAIAALVIAAVAATVLITLMITDSQRDSRQVEIERERAEAARLAAQSAQSQQSQQPVIVTVPQPQSQPVTVPVPVPVPVPSESAPSSPEAANVLAETEITTRLLKDQDLASHVINAKVDRGVATLSGEVPSEELKSRAERIAGAVKGVERVVNDITVKS